MDKEIGRNHDQILSKSKDSPQFLLSKSKEQDEDALSLSKVQKISTISELAKNLSNNLENISNSMNKSIICNLSPLDIDDLPSPLKSNFEEKGNQSKILFKTNEDLNLNSNQDNNDVVDVMPKAMSFTWFDILLNLFSIFCYIIDVISDIVTCFVHFQTKNFVFFYLTLVFIIFPTLITTFISLRWYVIDAKNESGPLVSRKRWVVRSFFLFFQMGQIMRYIDSLFYGIKYMNKPDVKYYQYMVHEDTDATMLRLFECFLESAPQLLIQLYLIIMRPVNTENLSNSGFLFYVLFPYFSCCISLFSIALSIASYYKSLRMSLPNKVNLSMIEMGVQVIWRLFMLLSRILALTLFITSFDYLVFIVLLAHFLIMFIWILTMKTNFCENLLEEVFYDALVAIMFIFCMFNPIDNDTRPRYTIFFIFMFIENSFLLFFWSQHCIIRFSLPCDYKIELICLYYFCFFTGIVIMVFYYLYCHPSKSIKLFRTKEDLQINKRRHSYVSRDQQRRVFDERDWATELEIKRLKDQLSKALDSSDIKQIGKVKKVFKRKRIS